MAGGLALIWAGYFLRWTFVRNPWFRLAHLAAIGIVTAGSLAGIVCPLTEWENQLRLQAGTGTAYRDSFLQHWIHRFLFYQADERIFTAAYVLFFLAVLLSLWIVPPQPRSASKKVDSIEK